MATADRDINIELAQMGHQLELGQKREGENPADSPTSPSQLRIRTPRVTYPEDLEACQDKCKHTQTLQKNQIPDISKCFRNSHIRRAILYISLTSMVIGLYHLGSGFLHSIPFHAWLGAICILIAASLITTLTLQK